MSYYLSNNALSNSLEHLRCFFKTSVQRVNKIPNTSIYNTFKDLSLNRVFFWEKYLLPNHDIFVSRSSLDLGSVSMHAHGLCASCRSVLSKNKPITKKLEAKNFKTGHPKITNITDLIEVHVDP